MSELSGARFPPPVSLFLSAHIGFNVLSESENVNEKDSMVGKIDLEREKGE